MDKTPDELLREWGTGNFADLIPAFRNEALQGVIGAKEVAELIKDLLDDDEDFSKEELREYVQMIEQSVTETINWLNALDRYARIQSGKL